MSLIRQRGAYCSYTDPKLIAPKHDFWGRLPAGPDPPPSAGPDPPPSPGPDPGTLTSDCQCRDPRSYASACSLFVSQGTREPATLTRQRRDACRRLYCRGLLCVARVSHPFKLSGPMQPFMGVSRPFVRPDSLWSNRRGERPPGGGVPSASFSLVPSLSPCLITHGERDPSGGVPSASQARRAGGDSPDRLRPSLRLSSAGDHAHIHADSRRAHPKRRGHVPAANRGRFAAGASPRRCPEASPIIRGPQIFAACASPLRFPEASARTGPHPSASCGLLSVSGASASQSSSRNCVRTHESFRQLMSGIQGGAANVRRLVEGEGNQRNS